MFPAPAPVPAPAKRSRAPVVLALAIGGFVLVGGSCICCIGFASRGQLDRERAAHVGSAARLIALRDRLDRVHDGFPAQPVASACTETPPTEEVVVLSYSGLAAFRRGEGNGDIEDSDFEVTSSFLRGAHRPANDISDDDAASTIDSLSSPVRPLLDARWVAVMRTVDQRHPAATFNVFTGGYYHGWLVVFDLATGRALCAQPVDAVNTATVDVGTFQGSNDAAMDDLVHNVAAARERARASLSPQLRLDL